MSESKQNADNSVEINDQQEEYREWLAFAKTDYDSAREIEKTGKKYVVQ